MADVKWIKVVTNMFDNRKIKQIEVLPEGDAIIVVWFKLLCLAGNINESGFIYFTKEIPYTEEMMATEFNRPVNTIRLALKTFEQFGMIEIINDVIKISNWEKYQNVDGMDRIREQTRKRVAKFRENKKLSLEDKECNVTSNVTVTESNATEEDIDKDIERDIEEDKEKEKDINKKQGSEKINYQAIVDLYNETCVSLPRATALSDARRKAIKARLKVYSMDDLKTVFMKAQASSFLKGGNARNWQANFDWLLKDSNIAKVLDGNYDNLRVAAAGNRVAQQLDESYNMMAGWAESEG